jgi:hypothetical protein
VWSKLLLHVGANISYRIATRFADMQQTKRRFFDKAGYCYLLKRTVSSDCSMHFVCPEPAVALRYKFGGTVWMEVAIDDCGNVDLSVHYQYFVSKYCRRLGSRFFLLAAGSTLVSLRAASTYSDDCHSFVLPVSGSSVSSLPFDMHESSVCKPTAVSV